MYKKTLKSLLLNCGFSFLITHNGSKIKGTEMVSDILDHPVSVFDRLKSIWEEEKILVTSMFPIPTLFSKGFFFRMLKCRDCSVKG